MRGQASQVNTDPCDQNIPVTMMAHKINPHRTVAGALLRFAQRDQPPMSIQRNQELSAITEAPHAECSLLFGIRGLSVSLGGTIVHEQSRYHGQTDACCSITSDGPLWVCTGAWVCTCLDVGKCACVGVTLGLGLDLSLDSSFA